MYKSQKDKKIIKEIALKSGLDETTLQEKLNEAKEAGIDIDTYYYLKGWNLSLSTLQKRKKRCDNFIEKNKKDLKNMASNSKTTVEKIVATYARLKPLGITQKGYLARKHYTLPDEEIDELEKVLKALKVKEKETKEFYVDLVMEKSGWDRDKVIKSMDDAEAKGIPYKKYVQKGVYRYTDHWKEVLKDEINQGKNKTYENTNNYRKIICKQTGWSLAHLDLEFNKAKLQCECSWEDYCLFKLFNVKPEDWNKYETLGKFDKMRMKYNEHFTAIKTCDNKAAFNEIFKKDIDRKWFINTDLKDYDDFKKKCKGFNALFAKPIAATMGKGIQKFDIPKKEADFKKLFRTITSLPKSIVEDYIIQHPDVMAFCDTSVNTVRITTLNYKGKCKFLYAVFRMGQGSVVDNFHSGGICAYVDIPSGTVTTDAADLNGKVYEINPYSKKVIKGFKIPNWKAIINKCKKIYDKIPGVNLIGWDFAVTKSGAELIEGNPGASYVIAQVPAANAGFGIAESTSTPYLYDNKKKEKEHMKNKNLTKHENDNDNQKLEYATKLGITENNIEKYNVLELEKDDITELAKELEKRRKNIDKQNKYFVKYVCERTGWSNEEALKRMNQAKKSGYSYRTFYTKALYAKDSYDDLKSVNQATYTDTYYKMEEIMEEMNWSVGKYKLEFLKAKNTCGCSPLEYYLFRLYRLPRMKMRNYITLRDNLNLHWKYIDYNQTYLIFENKDLFNERFKEYINRKWFITDGLKYKEFVENIKGLKKIIYKPLNAQKGKGICSFDVNGSQDNKKIYNEIIKMGPGICEDFLVQHENMKKLYTESVNTVRVAAFFNGRKVKIIAAVLRMGQDKGVDNFCAGGITAGVNVKKGIVETNGVDQNGNVYYEHPVTKTKIKGFKIPSWSKIEKLVDKAAREVDSMRFIGWDIAILDNGKPEIIEGNHDQYIQMLQYPYAISENKGIRDRFKDVIDYKYYI